MVIVISFGLVIAKNNEMRNQFGISILGLLILLSLPSFGSECRFVVGHEVFGFRNQCSITNGCKVNWLKYANQEPGRVLITDETTPGERIHHLVYTPQGLQKAVAGFDPREVIKSSLLSLHLQAMKTKRTHGQFIVIGGLKNGSLFFEKSQVFASQILEVLQPHQVYQNYLNTWKASISKPDYEGFFTLVYLIADPEIGHPIWSSQRVPIEELTQNLLTSQQIPQGSANKVWALKATGSFYGQDPNIFLYDPAVDKK